MRRIDRPEPGLFKTRRIKGGPWLPVRIRSVRAVDDEGRVADRAPILAMWAPDQEETFSLRDIDRAWPRLHPIAQAEFDRLCASPFVHEPRTRIDLHTAPPLF